VGRCSANLEVEEDALLLDPDPTVEGRTIPTSVEWYGMGELSLYFRALSSYRFKMIIIII